MKNYDIKKFLHKRHRVIWLGLAGITFAIGVYLLLLITAPLPYTPPSPAHINWNKPVPRIELHEQRVYIPRLELNLIYGSDENSLLDGLWHRYPERGDPEKGGNFILAGHRFDIGFTPGATKRQSPLYHIDKVKFGDYIYVDFNGHRYQYEMTRDYTVQPSQVEIEAPSTIAKMTLYTCTLKGQADGREVLEATLIKKDVDPNAELAISSSTNVYDKARR